MRVAVTALALAAAVTYFSLCAKRKAKDAQMDRIERLQRFRGEYGRLCTLMARAIEQGHMGSQVVEAARGRGLAAPVYVDLRAQRRRTDTALDACKLAGVPASDLIDAGYDARQAVEQEWAMELPTFSEFVSGR